METRTIGIILNGVTGRMGTNQHLERSILAIRDQGGIRVSDDLTLMPDPILTGRNPNKLQALANRYGLDRYTTDLQQALSDPQNEVFFDASSTPLRATFVNMAIEAKKSIYCEKPTGVDTAEALGLAERAEAAGLKNGVVQDKLWLPGMRKVRMLQSQGFFGDLFAVRAEFGYWVFAGHIPDQPPQRPSWNYRAEDGGGILLDMFCHWRYLIDNLFGNVSRVLAHGATHIPERVDEAGKPYKATAEDAAYAIFELDNNVVCQFNSSWCTRVRRDDLLTLHIDGTLGSAVVGLRDAWTQAAGETPKPVWNPDIEQPIDFYETWQKVPDNVDYDNAFKIQWELFLRHVALDEPFPWSLREGAKGVQLAELGMQSWKERTWLDVPGL